MFGENLKKLREEKCISQEELAEAIGVSKSTIGMYEQGKRTPNNRRDILRKLADYFYVSIDYLLGYDAQQAALTENDRARLGIRPVSARKIRMLGKISCGEPMMCDEEYETFVDAIDGIQADFCLAARGDSMINARIFDGDIVFIREQESVENGEIAAIIVNDNEITLKRFYYHPDRSQVILQPENPVYKPMVYNGEELNHIRVLGKAVAFTSKIN